ncbi:MAG: winged helix-turn-helix domain-containing protein [Clostridia bacterium]|nr:winged helix-turn-helix domain-containing protein [Clostridia bacterium]
MNSKLIVKEIMETKGVTNADLANRLNITQAAMWDRLKLKKTVKGQEVACPNITVDKLNDVLRAMDYEIVIVPRGKSGQIKGAYLVDDTEDKK